VVDDGAEAAGAFFTLLGGECFEAGGKLGGGHASI
jgi:hypothetical protein